jgi:hypothetical protein
MNETLLHSDLLLIIMKFLRKVRYSFVEITCQTPTTVPNSYWSNITGMQYGATVEYWCPKLNPAMNLLDHRTLTCDGNGEWTRIPIFCSGTAHSLVPGRQLVHKDGY